MSDTPSESIGGVSPEQPQAKPKRPQANTSPEDTWFFGHPKGLAVLFSAEAWERFSYYGMRALLVLYLTSHLNIPKDEALLIYGAYTGLVYLTPIFGGLLADRILGARKAVIIGGALMALGHLAMAFEPLLYPALSLLILGNGFFKPNMSVIVGGLYEDDDPRRDGGYTYFYMGINLGAFFSPIVCGTLGESENWGWHYGFGAAGVGMVIGLLIFVFSQHLLGTAGYPKDMEDDVQPGTPLRKKDWFDIFLHTAVGCVIVAIGSFLHPILAKVEFLQKLVLSELLIQTPMGITTLLFVGLAAILSTFFAPHSEELDAQPSHQKMTAEDYLSTLGLLIVSLFVIFFWVGFEQAGGTMTLFADEKVERDLGFWQVPASLFQSINPFFIVLLAPLFSKLWIYLDRGEKSFPVTVKIAIGNILLGLGFIVLYFAEGMASKGVKVNLLWLLMVYLIHTMGELCLSPVGLSMVTKVSPKQIVSIMMGAWLMSSAVANFAAGKVGAVLEKNPDQLWFILFSFSIGTGILLLILTPLFTRYLFKKLN